MERIARIALVMVLAVALAGVGGTALAAEHGGQERGGQGQAAPAGAGQGQGQEHGGQGQAAPAGREPSPEEMAQAQAMMEQMMVPMMGQMMSVMLESMAKKLAEPQIAQNLATFTRNYYTALKDRGFNDEEAMRIVTSTGFPTVGGKQ